MKIFLILNKICKQFLFLIVFICFLGCKDDSQRWVDLFEDSKAPPILFEMANELRALANYREEITSRSMRDKEDPNVYEIGVIDEGVDITHPLLRDQIAFEVKDGKIVGAGLDLQAGDNWATPALFDASLFAFGSKAVKDGRISGFTNNPLDLLAKYNEQFMESFLQGLNTNPKLKDSLFSKITKNNTNLFGLYRFFVTSENIFDIRKYNDNKERNRLYSPVMRKSLKKDDFRLKFTSDRIHDIVDSDWTVFNEIIRTSNQLGLPYIRGTLWRDVFEQIEHADLFYQLWLDTYSAFIKKTKFTEDLEKFIEFLSFHKFSRDTKKEAVLAHGLNKLCQALMYRMYGPKVYDPFRLLAERMYNFHVLNSLKTSDGMQPITVETEDVFKSFDNFREKFNELGMYILGTANLDLEQRLQTEEYLDQVDKVLKMIEIFKKEARKYGTIYLGPEQTTEDSSPLRRQSLRVKHPYLLNKSTWSSHGTHVAEIISTRSKNIRIRPVRITLGAPHVSSTQTESMVKEHMKEFLDWVNNPMILKAIISKFPLLKKGEEELFAEDPFVVNPEKRTQMSEAIVSKLTQTIQIVNTRNPTGLLSNIEIQRALEYMGDRQIPLVNLSIGEEFSREVREMDEIKDKNTLEAIYSFLNFEYWKFRFGKVVNKYPRTLFVVAAGNSSTWVEGNSHSALPVDLYSVWLSDYENIKLGHFAPNNHVKNILGVSSIGDDLTLSPFDNVTVPIYRDIQFIFAKGEGILSAITTSDTSPIETEAENRLKEINELFPVAIEDPRILDYFIKLAGIRKGDNNSDGDSINVQEHLLTREEKEKVDALRAPFVGFQEMMVHGQEYGVRVLALRNPPLRGKKSGTSMAAPAVVGQIGALLEANARQNGMTMRQLLASPSYSAEVPLQLTYEHSVPLGRGRAGSVFRYIDDGIKMKKTLPQVTVNNFFDEVDKKQIPPENLYKKKIWTKTENRSLPTRMNNNRSCKSILDL